MIERFMPRGAILNDYRDMRLLNPAIVLCALILCCVGHAQMLHAAKLSLGNRYIRWEGAVVHGRIESRAVFDIAAHKRLMLSGPCFSITLGNGETVSSRQFKILAAPTTKMLMANPEALRAAGRKPGQALVLLLADKAAGLKATWSARVRSGCNFLREKLVLQAARAAVDIQAITLLESRIPKGHTVGVTPGSPIVTPHFFMGYENPMAQNIIDKGSQVICRLQRNAPLAPGAMLDASCVFGLYHAGQLRRDFLAYIESVRARPYKPFLLYVSWYDISFGGTYSQGSCLKSINAIGRQLAQKRGVKINSFLFDDGWDNRNSIWRFNIGFPHGFAPLAQAAAKFGAHIGVWLSPSGGYGSARDQRIAYAKAHGYEVDSGGLSISGPKYYKRFAAVCLNMIHRYGVNVFKFDGLAAGARAASAGQTLDGDAMLRLIRTLRLAEPRVYINQTTGTWPSPFWLLNVDSTWRGGGDHAFIGAGSWCQKWINYRDAEVYANVVKRAPLYPLNSLMVHGIIYARLTRRLHSMSDRGFADQVWSYFGSGTQLQELYITPSLLDRNNWNVLASAAKWSRRNSKILVDTHWIGGDPAKGEIYGWAAWANGNAIMTLRNPTAKSAIFTIHLRRMLQLPAGQTNGYVFTSPQVPPKAQKTFDIRAGKPYRIKLMPFEVKVLQGHVQMTSKKNNSAGTAEK